MKSPSDDAMKSMHTEDPERWSDRPSTLAKPAAEGQGGHEGQKGKDEPATLGALFGRVRKATEPSPEGIAAMARTMRWKARPPAPRWLLVWRLVGASVLVMVLASVVGAALYRWGRLATRVSTRSADDDGASMGSADAAARHRPRRPRPPAAIERLQAPASAVIPSASPAPAEEDPLQAPLGGTHPSQPLPTGDAPQPLDVVGAAPRPRQSTEATLMGDAFRQLRSGGDARAALRSIDAYERRFPDGVLRAESRVARAEALIALDRRREALPVLEELDEGGSGLTRHVRMTRAELRVAAGRCTSALHDLEIILAEGAGDAVGGRALYFRATCRLRAGEVGPGREDLARYLSLHADGELAVAARRAIGSGP